MNKLKLQVNINGNTREDLMAQAQGIMEAARNAERALREAYPHGRNYLQTAAHISDAVRFDEAYKATSLIRRLGEDMLAAVKK